MACETDRMSDEGYGAADVEGEIEVEYVRFIFDCCSIQLGRQCGQKCYKQDSS